MGDIGLPNVAILLFRRVGSFATSKLKDDGDGNCDFVGLPEGSYRVFEINVDGWIRLVLGESGKSPDHNTVDQR